MRPRNERLFASAWRAALVFELALGLSAILPPANGEPTFLPDSRHQQYETYGLFFEEQSMLIGKSGSRAWGALGQSLALFELAEWRWKPQIIAHASANS